MIGAENIIIGGFSQGGSMALYTGLSSKHKVGGIIAASSYLLLRGQYPSVLSSHARDIPIFAYHGTDDQVVPYDIAALSYQLLQSHHLHVQFETERGLGHGVSEEEISKMFKFVTEKLTRQHTAADKKSDL